jgi:hypothetical protein
MGACLENSSAKLASGMEVRAGERFRGEMVKWLWKRSPQERERWEEKRR